MVVSFRGCSLREKKKPGLRAGGVNGLHGHLARAPVDDAGRTGRMSDEAEQPSKGIGTIAGHLSVQFDRGEAGRTGYALAVPVDGVSDSPVAWSLESRHG